MAKQKVRGTSNAPMILAIIGGVIGLPAAICAGACAVGLTAVGSADTAAAHEAGNVFMTLGLIAAIMAIVFGIIAKKAPKIAGIGLAIATILSGITLVTFNVLTLIVVILLLIATIFAFVQKKEIVE